MRSRIIVLEGLDGCGKSTQLELLKAHYSGHGVRFITFPNYQSEAGRLVSGYLRGEFPEDDPEKSAYSASTLYAVDRYVSLKQHWGEYLSRGETIISARYVTSNAIYQMTKLPRERWEAFLEWLYDFEYEKLGIPRPDKVIYLDMPIEVSQKLLSHRYGGDENKKDIHETNLEFMKSCREAAAYLAARDGWQVLPCAENDVPRGVDDIQNEIRCRINAGLQKD